jgi:glycosyltransferase involved in cell wall biosynthesis
MPNREGPDRDRLGRRRPDRDRPDRNQPDQNRPDQNRPDRNRPDRNQPDRNQPDRNQRNRDRLAIVLLAPAASVHTARWSAALARAGHRVVVASWQPGPGLPGVDVRVAPAIGTWPAGRAVLTVRWLRRLIRDVRPDVVHVQSVGAHGLMAVALPGSAARVVTPWGSELRAARDSAIRATVVRLVLRRADLVLPTSAEVAAELTDRYNVPPTRTRVLSWGVSATLISALPGISAAAVRSDYGIPADATVVLSIRSTSASYRIREIVSAFGQAAADRPDLFLVLLAGHRPDRESARRAKESYLAVVRAAARGFEDRILIVDRQLTPEQTFALMRASDIAVSIPLGDQRSSSVLEAALAGCHIILSDIAPYQEMVSDGLAADLLAEPIDRALTRRLRAATADELSQRDNSEFILAREHGADKVAALEQIYRHLRQG